MEDDLGFGFDAVQNAGHWVEGWSPIMVIDHVFYGGPTNRVPNFQIKLAHYPLVEFDPPPPLLSAWKKPLPTCYTGKRKFKREASEVDILAE